MMIGRCLLIGFISGIITMTISGILLLFIIKHPIKKRDIRKYIIYGYMLFYRLSFIIAIIELGIIQLGVLWWLYKVIYHLAVTISSSERLASYFALTVLLIFGVPITLGIVKSAKRKQYNKSNFANNEDFEIMQSILYSFINIIIDTINKFPFAGIIHIINLGLVISVNITKLLNISTEFETTIVYMSIATFYAVDKVVDYFKSKYSDFWKKVDNRLFLTDEINQKVIVGFGDMLKIIKQIFDNYISTGKYEIPNTTYQDH